MKRLFVLVIFALAAVALSSPLFASGSQAGVGEKVKLTYWSPTYGEAETMASWTKAVIAAYKATHPNVDIEWIFNPGDYFAKAMTSLAAKNTDPDIFETSSGMNFSKANVDAGQGVALDDILPKDWEKTLMVSKIKENLIEGKLYNGIPTYANGGTFYYRKSLFDKAGVKEPQTWQELIDISVKLTTKDRMGLSLHEKGGEIFGQELPVSNGVPQFLTPDGMKLLFAEPAYFDRTVEALGGLRKINRAGCLLLSPPSPWWDPAALINDLVAIQWGGLWMFPKVQAALGDDFGVFILPPFDKDPTSRPISHFGGWSVAISGWSDHIPEAKEFVKWLWIDKTGAEFVVKYCTEMGYRIPINLNARKQAETTVYKDPRIHKIIELNEKWPEPYRVDLNYYTSVDSVAKGIYNQMVADVIATDRPIADLLREYSARFNERVAQVRGGLGK